MNKICKKHGELKEEDTQLELIRWKTKDGQIRTGTQKRCRLCRREKDLKYKHNHREQHLAYNKKWKKENRERVNELQRIDRATNPEKYRKWGAISRERLGPLKSLRDSCYVFDIEVKDYNRMLEEQNHVCAICKQPETRKSRTTGQICRLAIDHCHVTGKIRGLLCHNCNIALGSYKDSISLIQAAIAYLKEHQE